MSARFEIVRTDAKQPWHARFVGENGVPVWVTENYTRMVGAERAVVSILRGVGVPADHLAWNVKDVEKVIRDQWCAVIPSAPLVKYLDERVQP